MVKSPSLDDLKYFIEMGVQGSLSKAAKKLNISQPALTVALKRLEEATSASLVLRSKKGIILTQAGKELITSAKKLVQDWDSITLNISDIEQTIKGEFRIGCNIQVGLLCLDKFLPSLMSSYPDLNLQLVHTTSKQVLDDILNFRLDIGIVVDTIQHPDLVIKPICKDIVTLWTAENRRVAQEISPILLYNPLMIESSEILEKLQKSTIQYKRILPSTSLEIIARLTRAGMGISILPKLALQAMEFSGLIRVRNAPITPYSISIVYRVENRNVKAIREIASQIQQAFSDY